MEQRDQKGKDDRGDEEDEKADEEKDEDQEGKDDHGFEKDEKVDEEKNDSKEGHGEYYTVGLHWIVVGPCKQDKAGNCVMSPSFPDSYNNNQNCKIKQNLPSNPISAVSFAT